MSFIPPYRERPHSLFSPWAKKQRRRRGENTDVNGELQSVVRDHRFRYFLFTQRHPSEVALEVVHNILQKEDPVTIEQLEAIRRRVDIAQYFHGPLMEERTVRQINNNEVFFNFHVINLMIADHFDIPFSTQQYCNRLQVDMLGQLRFAFYVIVTICSRIPNPTRPSDFFTHMFCIRSFLSNNGHRTWIVLDSIHVNPAPENPPYHFIPYKVTDLQNFLFGSYRNNERRNVNRHVRHFYPWVGSDVDDIQVFGFFPGNIERLDRQIHISLEEFNRIDQQFDRARSLMHRPDRIEHNRYTGSVSMHYLHLVSDVSL